MPRVHRLPEALANRIAAGEVVERPASVVKELAENSLDAGATHVEVDLRAGGTRLIAVADDGSGMEREDAVLAVERFCTSKIASPDDLHLIRTMGFRGEALPSIGAVSRMRLTTRPLDSEEGTLVVVEGGTVERVEAVGCPPGTRVEVADLFYNTPARRKFLSSPNTERGHCHDWVVRLAMARPDVAFRLLHDRDLIFSSPGTGDLMAVLVAAFGSNAAREFLPVVLETEEVTLTGFVSGPRLMRATRQYQFFFVNGRFIRSRALSHAVTQAYGSLLPAGRQPVCSLHLAVPVEGVDPNVHPTKIEVRFAAEARIHDLAERAVREALEQAGLRPRVGGAGAVGATGPALEEPPLARATAGSRLRVGPLADKLDARDDGLGVHAQPLQYAEPPPGREATVAPGQPDAGAPGARQGRPLEPEAGAGFRVLGQLVRRYILAEVSGRLFIIDQHRAAERVLLDRLSSGPPAKQFLALPVTLELTPAQAAAAADNREGLADLGFDLEPFGPSGWLLRSVPAGMVSAAPETFLGDMLDEMAAWRAAPSVAEREARMRATVACHAAVTAGEALSYGEMQALVGDLLATNSPAVCPHGDPVILALSAGELDRRFERRREEAGEGPAQTQE